MNINRSIIINLIFPCSALFFSILWLFYVFYKSEIISQGVLREYYKTYYIIGILSFLFSIFIFLFNENIKKNIFLLIFGILISFYILEAILSFNKIFYVKNLEKIKELKKELYFESTGNEYDYRTAYQVMLDSDERLEILIQPEYFWSTKDDVFPLSGKPNSKIIIGNENGYYANYFSDKYGFRNPNDVWEKNKTKYLLLGDSFVHGFAVNKPDDISYQLRELSKENVINLGFGGNGPLTSYATLKEFFPNNVENILWFFFEGNDLSDLTHEKKNKILVEYFKDDSYSQNLKLKEKEIKKVFKNYTDKQLKIRANMEKRQNRLIKYIMLWNLRSKVHFLVANFGVKKDLNTDDNFNLYLDILNKVNSFSKQNNSKLYFIFIPAFERYSNKDFSNKYYFELIEYLKKNKIELIDLHYDLIIKQPDPLELYPFRMGGHFNEYGYKKISKFIYSSIN